MRWSSMSLRLTRTAACCPEADPMEPWCTEDPGWLVSESAREADDAACGTGGTGGIPPRGRREGLTDLVGLPPDAESAAVSSFGWALAFNCSTSKSSLSQEILKSSSMIFSASCVNCISLLLSQCNTKLFWRSLKDNCPIADSQMNWPLG